MTPLEIILGVATLLSIASGIYFSNRSASRDKKKDDQAEASQMSIVMVKLDNIDSTVKGRFKEEDEEGLKHIIEIVETSFRSE